MKIDVNNLESTKVRLTVTAEKDDLTSYLDKAREENMQIFPVSEKDTCPEKLSTSVSDIPL